MPSRKKNSLPKLTPWKVDEDHLLTNSLASSGGATLIPYNGWPNTPITLEKSKLAPIPVYPPMIQLLFDRAHKGRGGQMIEDQDFFWINKRPQESSTFQSGKVVIIACTDWLDIPVTGDGIASAVSLVSRVKIVLTSLEDALKTNGVTLLFIGPRILRVFPLGRSFFPCDDEVLVESITKTTVDTYYFHVETDPGGGGFIRRANPTTREVTLESLDTYPTVDINKWISGGEFLLIDIGQAWYNGQNGVIGGLEFPFDPSDPTKEIVLAPTVYDKTYQFVNAIAIPHIMIGGDRSLRGTYQLESVTDFVTTLEDVKSQCLSNIQSIFDSVLFDRSQLCMASLKSIPDTSDEFHSKYLDMSLDVTDEIISAVSGKHSVIDWPDGGGSTSTLLDQVVSWIRDFYSL